MIYLLAGNKKERKDFVRELCTQQGLDMEKIQNFYEGDFDNKSFEEIIPVNTGLFDERECFVIHDLVRDLKIKSILKDYSDTSHLIIFSEETILKKDLTSFEKAGVIVQQFEKEQKIDVKKYNTFDLADLLGRRDKKNLWLGFREAISQVSAEEIHGILFWQLKNLALVKNSNRNPGMSPFVYNKNQSFINNFSIEEIYSLSDIMVRVFHNRDTYSTLEIDLEKLILSL